MQNLPAFFFGILCTLCPILQAQPIMERLDRGVVAVHQADGSVFVSWRLLASDPEDVAFNLYRVTTTDADPELGPFVGLSRSTSQPQRINDEPLEAGTWYVDRAARLEYETAYFVRPVVDREEGEDSARFTLAPGSLPLPYHRIPIETPEGYTPNDGSVGDLTGDGRMDIVLKQEGRARDNAHAGETDPVLLQAYTLDGEKLWEIDLGINIRAGAHYTQFIVYDFDGDGRAEVAAKTADGTRDGLGQVIGDPNADHRNEHGYILQGPEYLTVFDGRTGAALATTEYVPPRHPTEQNPSTEQLAEIWGDGYGNRMDRFLAGVAYLDGERPSLIMARGYYTRSVVAAWDFRDGELSLRWVFDSDSSEENRAYAGQGNHSLSIADVDGDGRQEIIYGAMVLDHDGTGLHSTGWGHGDALHVGNLLPSRPGLEIFTIQERFDEQGMSLRDAASGEPIFTVPSVKAEDRGQGPGRGLAINMDPRFPGAQMWSAGAGINHVYSAEGTILFEIPRGLSTNFAVWWDGDLQRELLDHNFILKWNWETESVERLLVAHGSTSNNGTKATPVLSGDIWGDWREEVIWRSRDNQELRIYTTTLPTPHRIVTLLHDPQYRVALAWQNVAYNQPPHPSFHLGEGDPLPDWPEIQIADEAAP